MWQEGPASKLDQLLLTVYINGPFLMQENEYLHFLEREGQVEKDSVFGCINHSQHLGLSGDSEFNIYKFLCWNSNFPIGF